MPLKHLSLPANTKKIESASCNGSSGQQIHI
jgi:hypothetical protein